MLLMQMQVSLTMEKKNKVITQLRPICLHKVVYKWTWSVNIIERAGARKKKKKKRESIE